MVPNGNIPSRAETLELLELMGNAEPILMLAGDEDGYGTRWIMHGQQVQPGIARYLMEEGFIAESGRTEFGARLLTLTAEGKAFLHEGQQWWSGLSLLQKLKVRILG